jgi:hypothetical protein
MVIGWSGERNSFDVRDGVLPRCPGTLIQLAGIILKQNRGRQGQNAACFQAHPDASM